MSLFKGKSLNHFSTKSGKKSILLALLICQSYKSESLLNLAEISFKIGPVFAVKQKPRLELAPSLQLNFRDKKKSRD